MCMESRLLNERCEGHLARTWQDWEYSNRHDGDWPEVLLWRQLSGRGSLICFLGEHDRCVGGIAAIMPNAIDLHEGAFVLFADIVHSTHASRRSLSSTLPPLRRSVT